MQDSSSGSEGGPGSEGGSGEPRWHQALAYAVLGARRAELGHQTQPDPVQLARRLRSEPGQEAILAQVRQARAEGRWPHQVPADLMVGLGYAQFAAALSLLQRELGLDAQSAPPRVAAADQPITAAARRLLDDVPPHHGS